MSAQSTDGDSAPSSSQWISSEWHRIQPVEPRMHADRDFSKGGESTSARINSRGALGADWKANFGGMIKINLYRKLSLRLHRVCRIELRNDVAGQVLPLSVGPPDTVHFRRKDLSRVKVERDFNRLPDLHILERLLIKAGQEVAVLIDNER